MKKTKRAAADLDLAFDAGKSVLHRFNVAAPIRPNRSPMRVNVDFPLWMVQQLDREAERVGVTRQSLIKLWLAERLDETARATGKRTGAA
ncbi:MAG: hypothetical protein RL026_1471 [Pseudomonadota bacterium]|jgi:hypothetical protein